MTQRVNKDSPPRLGDEYLYSSLVYYLVHEETHGEIGDTDLTSRKPVNLFAEVNWKWRYQ